MKIKKSLKKSIKSMEIERGDRNVGQLAAVVLNVSSQLTVFESVTGRYSSAV